MSSSWHKKVVWQLGTNVNVYSIVGTFTGWSTPRSGQDELSKPTTNLAPNKQSSQHTFYLLCELYHQRPRQNIFSWFPSPLDNSHYTGFCGASFTPRRIAICDLKQNVSYTPKVRWDCLCIPQNGDCAELQCFSFGAIFFIFKAHATQQVSREYWGKFRCFCLGLLASKRAAVNFRKLNLLYSAVSKSS